MLTTAGIESILSRLPRLTLGVVGDLFLDQYFDLDDRLTEPSLETGLPAYQVTAIRNSPGAAGTVLNNLASLGVGRILILTCIGEDGQGLDLRRSLERLRIDLRYLFTAAERFTPTYLKPMLQRPDAIAQELNRLDIKNRAPLPRSLEEKLLQALPPLWNEVDALLVSDQVSEPECGVITAAMRAKLGELGRQQPQKLLLVDSRERIGLFQQAALKPNVRECLQAQPQVGSNVKAAVECFVRQSQRPVFCTQGEQGILLGIPQAEKVHLHHIPSYPVTGPVDTVGAGDSTSSGIACALAAGASLEEAAAFGCLVASITVQQLGTTGTATPAQIRHRWQQVAVGVSQNRS
jgi:rfaE bifunctional protein kinase chain/domain